MPRVTVRVPERLLVLTGALLWVLAVLVLRLDPTEWSLIVALPALCGLALSRAAVGRGLPGFTIALLAVVAMVAAGSGYPDDVHQNAVTYASMAVLVGLAAGPAIAWLGLPGVLLVLGMSTAGVPIGFVIGGSACDDEYELFPCLDEAVIGAAVGLVAGSVAGCWLALKLRRRRRSGTSSSR